jgi:hypothetical protein
MNLAVARHAYATELLVVAVHADPRRLGVAGLHPRPLRDGPPDLTDLVEGEPYREPVAANTLATSTALGSSSRYSSCRLPRFA